MRNRGSFNRRTGKTTPRHKAKTHWGRKRRAGGAPAFGRSGISGSPGPSKPK